MKSILSTFSLMAFLAALAPSVLAQELIKVEVIFDQQQYLPGEALSVGVRITNQSGQAVEFGQDDEWLNFTVETMTGKSVARLKPVKVKGEFTSQTQSRTTARFEIGPCYNFTESGTYSVAAAVTIKDWGRTFLSDPKRFDIVKGNAIWSQEFGVPDEAGAGGPPEIRKYTLLQSRNKEMLNLYVRLTDATEQRTYKVFPLGPLVTFRATDQKLDRLNHLHVLHQNGRQTCGYSVVSPAGEVLMRKTYQITSQPKLVADAGGGVEVVGGVLLALDSDLPQTAQVPAAPAPTKP